MIINTTRVRISKRSLQIGILMPDSSVILFISNSVFVIATWSLVSTVSFLNDVECFSQMNVILS